MFCDVAGSTELAARLGAETWGEVVGAYQAFGGKCVERYEGYLAQVLGDGLLVYFGYPQAQENDPERAVRCALEIRDGLPALNQRLEAGAGVRLAVRMGVHTGPVVVEEVGAKGRREILALGDTANVAARLQEKAAADTVVLSEDTLRLVPGVFLTDDLGALSLKGVRRPLRAYRVIGSTGVRSRLDVTARRTPLVGRSQEVGLLLDRWERVLDGGGQAVMVGGEAGVGKSRLVEILRGRLAGALTPGSRGAVRRSSRAARFIRSSSC